MIRYFILLVVVFFCHYNSYSQVDDSCLVLEVRKKRNNDLVCTYGKETTIVIGDKNERFYACKLLEFNKATIEILKRNEEEARINISDISWILLDVDGKARKKMRSKRYIFNVVKSSDSKHCK